MTGHKPTTKAELASLIRDYFEEEGLDYTLRHKTGPDLAPLWRAYLAAAQAIR